MKETNRPFYRDIDCIEFQSCHNLGAGGACTILRLATGMAFSSGESVKRNRQRKLRLSRTGLIEFKVLEGA